MLGEIRNAHGERLDYAFHEGAEARREILVIGHGVTANKDREWAVALAESVAGAGTAALRFSFSGNGESEGDFRRSCPTKEVEDLGAVLDALDGWRIAYAGHSMGAAVGVLRASRDERVRVLVSLGGMVDTAGFARRKFGALTPGRDCMWDKPECPLSQEFLDDMERVGSVEELGAEVRVPWLLVHGTADTVVPPEESEGIARRAPSPPTVTLLEGADHVFSGAAARTMAVTVTTWLHRRFA